MVADFYNLGSVRFFRKTDAQDPGFAGKNRPGNIKIVVIFVGNNSFKIATLIVSWSINPDQLLRDAFRKCVCQYLTISKDKNIFHRRVAQQVIVKQVLQGNQVVDENAVGSFQGQLLGKIFSLSDGGFAQAFAETVGYQNGNE